MFKNKIIKSLYQILEYTLNEYNHDCDYFKFRKDTFLNYKNINSLRFLIEYNSRFKNKGLEDLVKHLEEEHKELKDVIDSLTNKTEYERFDLIHLFEEETDCLFLLSNILSESEDSFFECFDKIKDDLFRSFNIIHKIYDYDLLKTDNILNPLLKFIYFKSIEFYYPILIFNILESKEIIDSTELINLVLLNCGFNSCIDTYKIMDNIMNKRSLNEFKEDKDKIFKEIRSLVRCELDYNS